MSNIITQGFGDGGGGSTQYVYYTDGTPIAIDARQETITLTTGDSSVTMSDDVVVNTVVDTRIITISQDASVEDVQ